MFEKINVFIEKVNKISIPVMNGFELIPLADILYMEADASYTIFHLSDKKKIISTTNLGQYDKELINEPFLRIHQSYIVNLNKIKSYIKADNGYVVLENGIPLCVSKSRKEQLLVFFKIRRISSIKPKQSLVP